MAGFNVVGPLESVNSEFARYAFVTQSA